MMMDLLNHVITVSIVILAIILLRVILGNHISPTIRYGLWLLVVLKLLVPVTFFETGFSLNGLVEDGIKTANNQPKSSVSETISDKENFVDEVFSSSTSLNRVFEDTDSASGMVSDVAYVESDHSEMISKILFLGIWLSGAVVLAFVLIGSNLHLYLKIKKQRVLLQEPEIPLNVYLTECVRVPCMFGGIRPSIYLTEECLADEEMKRHILTHEYVHYRQKDHLWAVIRSLCLVLYWYHPLVWVAVKLSGTDSELSCDWNTIKLLGEENRGTYGRTLIKISCENSKMKNPLMCATGISNDAKEVKKRLQILVNRTKKSKISALVAFVSIVCLAGFAFGEENDSDMRTGVSEENNEIAKVEAEHDVQEVALLEVPEYPLSEEVVSAALAEAGLNWHIAEEQSWAEKQRVFTLKDINDSTVMTMLTAGDENGRALNMSFMSKLNETADTNHLQAPIREEEFLKVLEMAAMLYGGFESVTQISEDYMSNFDEKSVIKDVAGESYALLSYAQEGKWISSYGNITCRVNFGIMNDTEERDYQSFGIYNSGDYILFSDDMEEGEVFEANPEIVVNAISEEEFISAYENGYHEDTVEFNYNKESGIYKFYEVQIKDTEYCPEYPFNIRLYFGVNLSADENNLDRAFVFEDMREDYYFLPSAVNYGVSVAEDVTEGGKKLVGKFGIRQFVIMDDTGEVIQKKNYDYNTMFEIQVLDNENLKVECIVLDEKLVCDKEDCLYEITGIEHLEPGDCIAVYYNGITTLSVPAQFSMIYKIEKLEEKKVSLEEVEMIKMRHESYFTSLEKLERVYMDSKK